MRISISRLGVQAEGWTPSTEPSIEEETTMAVKGFKIDHGLGGDSSSGFTIQKKKCGTYIYTLQECKYTHTHSHTHTHTPVPKDVHRNVCMNTYPPPKTPYSRVKMDMPQRPSSPGPLVCDGDTGVLGGHCCPLLGLHDEGFCIHQAKSIEVAD